MHFIENAQMVFKRHCQIFLENTVEESLTTTSDMISVFFSSLENWLQGLPVKMTAIYLEWDLQEDGTCCGHTDFKVRHLSSNVSAALIGCGILGKLLTHTIESFDPFLSS